MNRRKLLQMIGFCTAAAVVAPKAVSETVEPKPFNTEWTSMPHMGKYHYGVDTASGVERVVLYRSVNGVYAEIGQYPCGGTFTDSEDMMQMIQDGYEAQSNA